MNIIYQEILRRDKVSFEFKRPELTKHELELLKEFDVMVIVPKDISELERRKSEALAEITYSMIGQANTEKLIEFLEK